MVIDRIFISNKKFLLFITLLCFFCLAWINRFIQDDALISFRYAENFVSGKGLVYNDGEKVEGYTNFLWVMIESFFFTLNLPIITSVHLLSILFFIISLMLVYLLTDKLIENSLFSFFTLLLLGANPSFLAYATGGLETQLQALLVLITFLVYNKIYQSKQVEYKYYFILSVVFIFILLNRLDSVILIFLISISLVLLHFFKKEGEALKKLFLLYLLPILVIGYWLLWKKNYYGDILPNTFYVKAISSDMSFLIFRGFFFVGLFGVLSFLLPMTYILFFNRKAFFYKKKNISYLGTKTIMICYVLLHVLYIIKVGGGFMEFRYFIQITPIIYIIISTFMTFNMKRKAIYVGFLLLFVNPIIGKILMPNYIFGVESIENLSNHLYKENEDWVAIGKKLNTFTDIDNSVVIGVNPAGAIPFYSKLESIDMLGLNDKWVAMNGLPYRRTPGHFKITSLAYLLEREVNIVIGKPIMVNNAYLELEREKYSLHYLQKILPSINIENISTPQVILEIPISKNYTLVTWYLIENLTIDNLIKKNEWYRAVIQKD